MSSIKNTLPNRERYNQGLFTPENPNKYIGELPIRYLSSWELKFMRVLDNHPFFLKWSSESIKISYYNPIKKKQCMYIPDFYVEYIDRNGKRHNSVIEIKPAKEALSEKVGKSLYNKAMYIQNMAKWEAAKKWCSERGINFQVLTESQLYSGK